MRKYWYRRIITIILAAAVSLGGGYCFTQYQKERNNRTVSTETLSKDFLIPGGMPVGIYMETDGVMILSTEAITAVDGLAYEPAEHLVKPGDYIIGLDDTAIANKKELIRAVGAISAKTVVLHLRRENKYLDVKIKPVQSDTKEYKLGIWVRDNAQGLGTVTFLNGNSEFGALGHGIHDTNTDELLELSQGRLYETSIQDIEKGTGGQPGGMQGIIVYNNHNILGSISKNTDAGIFGKIDKIDALFENQSALPVGTKEEIVEGDAVIRCCVEGVIKEYKIRVTKIDQHAREVNKGIEIQIIDEELLNLTGGIVQGMSGSPIIQNGKIIGAVTHVFVQDSTRGYGIFIENMLEQIK